VKEDIMAECAQLSQFDDEVYKVTVEGVQGQRCCYCYSQLLHCGSGRPAGR
jgi:seryl-tRNA synthetase